MTKQEYQEVRDIAGRLAREIEELTLDLYEGPVDELPEGSVVSTGAIADMADVLGWWLDGQMYYSLRGARSTLVRIAGEAAARA